MHQTLRDPIYTAEALILVAVGMIFFAGLLFFDYESTHLTNIPPAAVATR